VYSLLLQHTKSHLSHLNSSAFFGVFSFVGVRILCSGVFIWKIYCSRDEHITSHFSQNKTSAFFGVFSFVIFV